MNDKCSHVWYLYPDDGSATLQCCKCKIEYENDDIGDYVMALTQRAERAEARVKELEDKNLRDETRLEMVLNLLTSGHQPGGYDKAIKRLKHWGYEELVK